MTVFFIIISFVLNIIAILGIVILFLRQNKLMQVEENQKKMVKDMEELMSSYLLEMKDENERFIERVKEMNEEQLSTYKVPTSETITMKEPDRKAEPTVSKIEKHDLASRLESTVNLQAVRAYQRQKKNQSESESVPEPISFHADMPPQEVLNQVPQTNEKLIERRNNELLKESLLFQVLIMKQQGFTVEEMAKRLNKGKSEIALLLKFHENHEKHEE